MKFNAFIFAGGFVDLRRLHASIYLTDVPIVFPASMSLPDAIKEARERYCPFGSNSSFTDNIRKLEYKRFEAVEDRSMLIPEKPSGFVSEFDPVISRDERIKEIAGKMLIKFGREAQINKVQEEALELALAISHYNCPTKDRHSTQDAVYGELADMWIMMAQAFILFDADVINQHVDRKLKSITEKYLTENAE